MIAAATIVLAAGLSGCKDESKKTEINTTDSTVLTQPVIVKDNVVIKKDSLPVNPADSDKTEQAPPPRGH